MRLQEPSQETSFLIYVHVKGNCLCGLFVNPNTASVTQWYSARVARDRSGFDIRSRHARDLKSGACSFPA